MNKQNQRIHMRAIRSWLRADQCLVQTDLKSKIGHAAALGFGSLAGAGLIYTSSKAAAAGTMAIAKSARSLWSSFEEGLKPNIKTNAHFPSNPAALSSEDVFKIMQSFPSGKKSSRIGQETPLHKKLCEERRSFYISLIGLGFVPPFFLGSVAMGGASLASLCMTVGSPYAEYQNFKAKFSTPETPYTGIYKPINFCQWTRFHFKCTAGLILGASATAFTGAISYGLGSESWKLISDIYQGWRQYRSTRWAWQIYYYNHEWKSELEVKKALRMYADKKQLSNVRLIVSEPVMVKGFADTSEPIHLDVAGIDTASQQPIHISSKDLWTFQFLARLQNKTTTTPLRMLSSSVQIL